CDHSINATHHVTSPSSQYTAVVVSLFSLYWYGDHPDLHSFPTRRSSDLGGWGCHVPYSETIRTRLGRQSVSISIRMSHFVEIETDRKSTRLNSSHVKISYAVFCLKKKNERDREEQSQDCHRRL